MAREGLVGSREAGRRGPLARERGAAGLLFLVTGATFGTFAARVPAVQERLDLTAGELGLGFAGLMVGAFAGLPLAGALVARIGSRPVVAGSLLLFAAGLASIAVVPTLAALTIVLFVFGTANSGVDVAINAHGARVERDYGRPILSSLHAMFSAGALVAAGVAAAVAAAEVGVATHFTAAAVLLGGLGLAAVGGVQPQPRPDARAPLVARPTRALALAGLVAFSMVVAEDVANTWSAVYLRTVAEASPGLAAAAFAVYSGGMLGGRLVADRVVRARGPRFTLRAGGVLATAGAALAVAVPRPTVAIVGLGALGVGLAPVFPVLFGVVAHRDPAGAATAIAAVTTMGYFGSVVGPPSVGGLAELVGLRAAFLLVPFAALALVISAGRLRDAPTRAGRETAGR